VSSDEKPVVATVVTGFRHRGTTSGKGDGNFAIDANIAKKPGMDLGSIVKADVSDEIRVTTDGAVRIVTINQPNAHRQGARVPRSRQVRRDRNPRGVT
jgi:hypothetical protein